MTLIKNQTKFGQHYVDATERLIEAIAEPSQFAFDHAHSAAILAIGNSFDAGRESIEWELGQKLARTVSDTAKKFGYGIDGWVTR